MPKNGTSASESFEGQNLSHDRSLINKFRHTLPEIFLGYYRSRFENVYDYLYTLYNHHYTKKIK